MKVAYSVTFEFETRQPITHRGEITTSSAGSATGKAVRAAKKALKPNSWTSLVCVLSLLDRSAKDPNAKPRGRKKAA